ncbi:MAG: hypothetical protein D6732_17830 [Methanobacteriota archaeon]|nr:MAG: hypothetical protein D6732_17830 [Euryarchaeota archaeon]
MRRPLIADALRKKETFITSYSYFLYKDEVMEVAQAENIEIDPKSLSIRSAVESIGISRVIEEVGLQRVIEEVGFKRVIEEMGLQRVIEEFGIKDLVKILTPEQKEQLRKLLSME